MPRTVKVKGQTVQFPNSFSDEQIDAIIQRDFFPKTDVRSQIAARGRLDSPDANPASFGDPNAVKRTALEEYAPFVAHPLDTAKGIGKTIVGGVASLAHPIDAVKQDFAARGAAYDRIKERGLLSDDPENLRDAAEVALPLVGPALAQAGRQMNSTNPREQAEGTGSAIALTSGPEMVKGMAKGAGAMLPTVEAQIVRYMKVIDPKNIDPVTAREIATRLIDEKTVLSDPRTELTAIQESRAAAADKGIDTAIGNMKEPVDLANVNQSLEASKTAQTQPYGPDSEATISKIDKYQKEVLPMNAVGDVATRRDVIQPETARTLRQQFDASKYEKGSTTSDANARGAVGDALRGELNADPAVKAANEAFQKEKRGKDLAESIPAQKQSSTTAGTVARMAAKGAGTAVATALGGPVIGKAVAGLLGAHEVSRYVREVLSSPAYKTWSAVKKAQFADAITAGDIAKAGQIAGATVPIGNQEVAREILRQKRQ